MPFFILFFLVGLSGAFGACGLSQDSKGVYLVGNYAQLKMVGIGDCPVDTSSAYRLTADIDASASMAENPVKDSAGNTVYQGFVPIGTDSIPFQGHFYGDGHLIRNLTIYRPDSSYVGLLGSTGNSAIVTEIGLIGGSITGNSYVGALIGEAKDGFVRFCFSAVSVKGRRSVGGLVGISFHGTTVFQSFSTGDVYGWNSVGGLIGAQYSGSIGQCYTTGNVRGYKGGNGRYPRIGGLVGYQTEGVIYESYSTSNVSGDEMIGGLIGSGDNVTGAYFAGSVNGNDSIGALFGDDKYFFQISPYSYWNNELSDLRLAASADEGTMSYNTIQMKRQAFFSGFNFTNTWIIREDSTYPGLRGVDNAPFAIPEIWEVAGSFDLHRLLENDYDIETLQKNLVMKVVSVNGDSSFVTATCTPFLGQKITVVYRVGEVREAEKDTLWGNEVSSYLIGATQTRQRILPEGLGKDPVRLRLADSSEYYALGTYEDLAAFATLLKDNDSANARLTSDISLTAGTASGMDLPISSFSGHFDGAGHIVDIGENLFNVIQKGARVENLGVRASVHSKFGTIGVLARSNYGLIKNCHTEGSVEGPTSIGGMVGRNEGVIDSSYNEASVSGSLNVGGIAGEDGSGASISHSYNKGVLRYVNRKAANDDKNFGGIVGTCSEDSLIGVYNLADLGQDSSISYIGLGGILGTGEYCFVDSSYNLGNIGSNSSGTGIGGILGYGSAFITINHSYNKGAIRGSLGVGGISGNDGEIYTSYNEGPVYGGDLVGGISGSGALIVASYNTAPVVGKEDVGGLSGSGGDISFSYNLGSVTGKNFVGGIAGDYRKNDLMHVYNIGTVKGDSIVGGIVGERAYDSRIYNAYDFGSVTASKRGSCVLGYEFQIYYAKVSSVFYNEDSCSLGGYWDGGELQNQTTKLFKNETVMTLLNLDTAYWEQGEAYPILYPYEKILEIRSQIHDALIPDIVPAAFGIRTEGLTFYIDGLTEETPVALFNMAGELEMKAEAGRNGFEYRMERPGAYILRIGKGRTSSRLLLLK